MNKTHFVTQNTALAQALIQCGASVVTIWNLYTEDLIRKAGFANAREMWNEGKGKPGKIIYYFEQDERLAALLKVWDETQALLDKGEDLTVDISAEDVMRVTCMALKQRRGFIESGKGLPPMVEIPNEGQVEKIERGGHTVMKHPGVRIVSINASAATKKRLNL